MMKNYIIVSRSMISVFVSAQRSLHGTMDWKDVTITTAGSKFYVPSFQEDNYEYIDGEGVVFSMNWKESAPINSILSRIVNIVYKNVSKIDLKGLRVDFISAEIKFQIKSILARGRNAGFLSLSPTRVFK